MELQNQHGTQKPDTLLRRILPALLICSAAVLLTSIPFWRVFKLPFLADDFQFLSVITSRGLKDQLDLFCRFAGVYFRPMGLVIWRLDQAVWGNNPIGYHLTNLFLCLAASGMLAAVTYRISRQPLAAAGAAMLFAVFPLHVEAVAFISARFTLLSMLFVACSIFTYLGPQAESDASNKSYYCSLIFALFAYLSKEDAFVLPALLFLFDMLFRRSSRPYISIGKRWLTHFVLSIGIFFLRGWVLKKPFGYQDPGGLSLNFLDRFQATTYNSLTNALQMHLVPVGKCDWPQIELTMGIAIAIIGILLALSWKLWRYQWRVLAIGAGWWPLSIVPVIPILHDGCHLESSRYLYLPSAGFTIVLAALVFGGVEGLWDKARKARLFMGIIIFLGYSFMTVNNLDAFRQAGDIVHQLQAEARTRPIKEGETWICLGLPAFFKGVLLFPSDQTLNSAVLLASGVPLDAANTRVVRPDVRSLSPGPDPTQDLSLANVARIIEWDESAWRFHDLTEEVNEKLLKRSKLAKMYPNLPILRFPGGPGRGSGSIWPINQLILIGSANNGTWRYQATGSDPIFRSPIMTINAFLVKEIRLAMAISPPDPGALSKHIASLSFRSSLDQGFLPRNRAEFRIIPDGRMHEYNINLGNHPSWMLSDNIRELRLDPINRPGYVTLGELVIIPYTKGVSR